MRILDECDLTLLRALAAFRPSRIPTPPVDAPLSFLHAEDVISVFPSIGPYLMVSLRAIPFEILMGGGMENFADPPHIFHGKFCVPVCQEGLGHVYRS